MQNTDLDIIKTNNLTSESKSLISPSYYCMTIDMGESLATVIGYNHTEPEIVKGFLDINDPLIVSMPDDNNIFFEPIVHMSPIGIKKISANRIIAISEASPNIASHYMNAVAELIANKGEDFKKYTWNSLVH